MKRGQVVGRQENIEPLKKFVGAIAPKNGGRHGTDGFTLEQVMIIFIVAFIAGIMAASLSLDVLRNILALIPSQQRQSVWLPKSMR